MTTTIIKMLDKNAKTNPDKAAIIYKDEVIKYDELDNITNRIANSMTAMGIKKGDRVGLMLPRIPELIIAFLSSVKIGAVPFPINYNLSVQENRALLSFLKPAIIFVYSRFIPLLDGLTLKGDITVIAVNGNAARHISWDALLNTHADAPGIPIYSEDVAYLNYTSGSTGEQKGAVTTHGNIYWNTVSAALTFKITTDDIHLCMFASFAHPHELFARPLYTGGAIVLLNEIFPKSLAKTIKDNNVTCMMGLAPMYEMLLDVARGHSLDSLRLPESGGMNTRPDLIKRFENTFGVPIYPVWGSTETTGIAIANRIDEGRKDGSVGIPCPYYEVKIVDERGMEVKTGEIGELIFKGPAVVNGYYGMDEETAACFNSGWYFSGDLGKMDEDGCFYFIDRKNAMMKVAGLKVYPSEIEDVLRIHPKIKEAAVVGSPDGLKGEIPKAVIVQKDGEDLTKSEVHRFCRGKLVNYKIPRIIEFRKELPKMSSGKIDRKVLMEESSYGVKN